MSDPYENKRLVLSNEDGSILMCYKSLNVIL